MSAVGDELVTIEQFKRAVSGGGGIDATNSFALGEKAHHPGDDGPVYVSKRNGNASEWGELAE